MKTTLKTMNIVLTAEQRALWVGLKDGRLDGRTFNIRTKSSRDSIEFVCPTENLVVEISEGSLVEVNSDCSDISIGHIENTPCVLHFPLVRIREDIGLVLAQIRGHFRKMMVVA